MNCTIVYPEDFVGEKTVRLAGARLAHLGAAARAKPGDRLTIGVLGGMLGRGEVRAAGGGSVEIEVTLDRPPPAPRALTLIAALPRPKSMRRVVHAATAMGVKRIYLIETWRVDKSYWQTPWLEPDSLRSLMVLALEQAVDTILPEIGIRRRFRPFVEDEIPAIARETSAFVAHPAATGPRPCAVAGGLTLAVGPEGGFTDYEIAALGQAGFSTVTLGERMLRVEEAVPALIGRLCP